MIRVRAANGQVLLQLGPSFGRWLPYDQIPPRVVNAFLAAEDRNFFRHGGVDVAGVGRALGKDVVGALHGKRPEGGSTITQQVAKNILLNNDVTLGRRLISAAIFRKSRASSRVMLATLRSWRSPQSNVS